MRRKLSKRADTAAGVPLNPLEEFWGRALQIAKKGTLAQKSILDLAPYNASGQCFRCIGACKDKGLGRFGKKLFPVPQRDDLYDFQMWRLHCVTYHQNQAASEAIIPIAYRSSLYLGTQASWDRQVRCLDWIV